MSINSSLKYRIYLGNLHSHSVYSGDCAKAVAEKLNNGIPTYDIWTPAHLLEAARESSYDFFAVTDHSSPEFNEFYKNGFTREHWENTKRHAEAATTADFLGLYGFEFSRNLDPDNGGLGHMGVYNSDGFQSGYARGNTFEAFYCWLTEQKNDSIVAQFNHPAMPGIPEVKNFKDYTGRNRERNQIITLAEIWNGEPENDSYQEAVRKIWALGWKVAPTAGSDIHGMEGFSEKKLRTGVLAAALTKDAVLDALKNRRVYATCEPKLKMEFDVNGHIMGSALDTRPSGELTAGLCIHNPGECNISKVEIVGGRYDINGGGTFVLSEIPLNPALNNIQAKVQNKYDFYYAVVYKRDETEKPVAYSAPVWMDNE